MKLKFAFAGIFGLILITSSLYLLLSSSIAQEASLIWRPTCNATLQGTTSPVQTPLAPWKESYDGGNFLTYCYINSSLIYIEKEVWFNFVGEPFLPTFPDTYIEKVAYTQPPGAKKVGDIRVLFDMYFPYYNDDPAKCYTPYFQEFTLVGNNNGNFSDEVGTFNDAFYRLNNTEKLCGQWITFSHLIDDYANDYGVSFDRNSRTLETFGLEMGNVYIKNIRVEGVAGTKQIW